jgi:putative polyketide hydroxylase
MTIHRPVATPEAFPFDDDGAAPVVIVGAGPAGLATAVEVARQGVRPLVIERHASTSIFPRATALSTRSMELMRSWGVEAEIRAAAFSVAPFIGVTRTLADAPTRVQVGFPTEPQSRAVSPVSVCAVSQEHVEPVLVDLVRRLGGEVRFDTELIGLSTGPAGVGVELFDRTDGRSCSITAQYVVGADGPLSTVRRLVGIPTEGPGTLGGYVSVLVRGGLESIPPEEVCGLYSIQEPSASGVLLPVDNDGQWVYAREHPAGAAGQPLPPASYWVDLIRRAAGVPSLEVEVLAVQQFEFAVRVAAQVCSGPVFLVGDAAHQMTPRGGMGLNTAIHDGHNLGWKLGWVLRGWASPNLLHSYEQERLGVGHRRALRSGGPSDRLGDGLLEDLGEVYRSGAVWSATAGSVGTQAADTDVAGGWRSGTFEPTAEPGARAPHVWLRRHGHRISTLDLTGPWLTLLAGPDGAAWIRAADLVAHETGAPITTYRLGYDVVDEAAAAAQLYELGDAGVVLIRPDGHIAWRTGGAVSDPATCLRHVLSALLGGEVDSTVAA